jgi:hypothetical protein
LFLFQALPPVRSKIKRVSKDQKNKHDKQNERPVKISGYDYTSWDKYDVVSFTIFIVIVCFVANEAGCTRDDVVQYADFLFYENVFNRCCKIVMKMYGGVEVLLHIFLTLVLCDKWSASYPSHFPQVQIGFGTY